MRSFTRGLLVGVGLGFLFAPLTGEQLRHVLNERFDEFRHSLPEDSLLNQCAHRLSDGVGHTREHLRDYAQMTVSKAIDTSATLGQKAVEKGHDLAHKAKENGPDLAHKAVETGQDLAHKARQTGQDLAHKARQTGHDLGHKARHTAAHITSSTSLSSRIIPESAHAQPRE